METRKDDALVIVDVQNDFLPDGALGVPDGDQVVPVLNHYIERFGRAGLPVIATRDWHPPNHCSFTARGGPWPPHCIAGTSGAAFAPWLRLPADAIVISKATDPDRDAYSGFDGTDLTERLRKLGVGRLWIGGLATDYCVLATVRDAIAAGFAVVYLSDASRAVNVTSGDGDAAEREIAVLGATSLDLASLAPA